MFDKEYHFRGTHAKKVIHLTQNFDGKNISVFKRNYDVYLLAPIVGFLYGIRSEIDKGEEKTDIFPDILIKNKDDLMFNYRLIMLLDKDYCPDFEKRVDKAFRLYNTDEAKSDMVRYDEYVRGGVDKIYEKIMENANGIDDYCKNLFEFIEEIDDRYADITTDDIIELCSQAKL